jgi:cell division protein FtsB
MNLKQGILISLAIIGMFLLLLIAVFGDKGAADLMRLRQEKALVIKKSARLEKENQELMRTIDRLKNDLGFIEDVARRELGMVRKDEVILKIRKEKE